MTWILLVVFCGYALLVLSGCTWQRKLLYHPSRYSLAEEKVFAGERGFVPWTNPAGAVIGWKFPAVTNPAMLVPHVSVS